MVKKKNLKTLEAFSIQQSTLHSIVFRLQSPPSRREETSQSQRPPRPSPIRRPAMPLRRLPPFPPCSPPSPTLQTADAAPPPRDATLAGRLPLPQSPPLCKSPSPSLAFIFLLPPVPTPPV
ncbi:unnamed protein product [Linum trigynum]|uniref:Uncharacterized protein n=1 Tax=Linum trigynum TaxID=586398 RepID=A0AAV2DGN4_9ROSI